MFKFILLGATQGLTEFLPVSSSGHLVVLQHFFGLEKDILFLDISLHMGTLAALLSFFFKDIISVSKKPALLGPIALATLATGIIGLGFKSIFESFFTNIALVGVFLFINGIILLLSQRTKDRQRDVRPADGALMGIVQGLAIAPGISRSGATIVTLLSRGISREEAFRFSFLASIPAVLGAFLLELKQISWPETLDMPSLLAGVAAAYLCGVLSLAWLAKIVKTKKIHYFGAYCILLGAGVLILTKP